MNLFCIGDPDTARGFRLAGLEAAVASDEREASAALALAVAREDCGVVIITRAVADLIRTQIGLVRLERSRPLIAEIDQSWPGHS